MICTQRVMKIERSKRFVKHYRRLAPHQRLKVDRALVLLVNNPWDKALRRHNLSGELAGCFSVDAAFDLRIVIVDLGEELLLLLAVGTHSQLYE